MKNLASLTVFLNDLMMMLDSGLLFGPHCIYNHSLSLTVYFNCEVSHEAICAAVAAKLATTHLTHRPTRWRQHLYGHKDTVVTPCTSTFKAFF